MTLRLDDWKRKPEFLKGAFCGCRRDLALLDRLTSRHPTLGDRLRELDAGLRTGLILGNRSRESSFLRGLPLLKARDLRPFSVPAPEDLESFAAPTAERPRERGTYRAPLLLVKEFLVQGPRPVVAVADRDVVFTDAFFGATFPPAQHDAAHVLAAILSSSLASWFFLMTGSTFGLWMQRIKCRDIELLPVPDPDTAVRSDAGRRLTRLAKALRRRSSRDADWKGARRSRVRPCTTWTTRIAWSRETACSGQGWQWKSGRRASVEAASIAHLADYAGAFRKAIEVWFSGTNRHHLHAEVFDLPSRAPLRVVRFALETKTRRNRRGDHEGDR